MRHKNPIVSVYWESTRPLRFLTIPVGLLATIGIFLRANSPTDDMALVMGLAPWYVWASILLTGALFRLYGLIYPEENCLRNDTCACIRSSGSIVVGIGNIIVWSVLFVSSSLAKDFGLGLLLIIPCIIEVWLLSRAIVAYGAAINSWKRRRKNE